LAYASQIKSDETVVFFPTTGALSRDGSHWMVPIHGWIYEAKRNSFWRGEVVEEVLEYFEIAADSEEGRRCTDRAALFLVDNERGKKLSIRIAGQVQALGTSHGNGHFEAALSLDAAEVRRHAKDGVLPFEALTSASDARRFRGQVLLPPQSGVSVISDIDDTIKVSDVRDRRELLRRTFVLPFEAVPGMAAAYTAWAESGATFHYVSSSPWQLYEPLEQFASGEGFPAGSYHLKHFGLKGKRLLDLFKPASETKPPIIRAILDRYPHHRFVLVGDSGEEDPEVYGLIARERPAQLLHIFIRRVDGADNGEERFAKAFAGIPAEQWTLFSDASALPGDLGAPVSK
jgi:Phosphatidate phosphatase APP1, catalytic domain